MTASERKQLVDDIAEVINKHPAQCLHFSAEDVEGLKSMAKHWSKNEENYRGLLSLGQAYERVSNKASTTAVMLVVTFLFLAVGWGVIFRVKDLLK